MSEASDAPDGSAPRASAIGMGGWSFASRAIAQGVQLIIFVVAARVLTPAEFGVFALVHAVSVLLSVIAWAGWREFVMSWSGPDRAIDQAFALSLLSGVAMAGAGFLAAGALALWMDDASAPALMAILAVCVFLSPVTGTLSGILVRSGRVADLSIASIVAELVGLAVAVFGLLAGWGVLALAAGKLAMQAINLAGVAIRANWRFRPTFTAGFSPNIIEMSRQILANRVITFFQANGATFVVGGFLGAANVGFYRAAERVLSAVSELIFEPMRLIAWVKYRSAADHAGEGGLNVALRAQVGKLLPLLILAAAPVFIGLALVADEVVTVVLGPQWAPAGPVLTILALGSLLMIPTVGIEALLSVAGQIRRLPPVLTFNAAVMLVSLLMFARFGLIATAFAQLSALFLATCASIWVQTRSIGADWRLALANVAPVPPALAAMAAVILGARLLVDQTDMPGLWRLALEIPLGAAVYFGTLLAIRPSLWRTALSA